MRFFSTSWKPPHCLGQHRASYLKYVWLLNSTKTFLICNLQRGTTRYVDQTKSKKCIFVLWRSTRYEIAQSTKYKIKKNFNFVFCFCNSRNAQEKQSSKLEFFKNARLQTSCIFVILAREPHIWGLRARIQKSSYLSPASSYQQN